MTAFAGDDLGGNASTFDRRGEPGWGKGRGLRPEVPGIVLEVVWQVYCLLRVKWSGMGWSQCLASYCAGGILSKMLSALFHGFCINPTGGMMRSERVG